MRVAATSGSRKVSFFGPWGASAKQLRTVLVIEYRALGILSASTGVLLAVAANAALAIFVFEPKVPNRRLSFRDIKSKSFHLCVS